MGYGVIQVEASAITHIAHGCIEVGALGLAVRLRRIHEAVDAVVCTHSPEEVAIERVFVSRNYDSALKLGQARGAALAAIRIESSVHDYAPREIKRAVVGFGAAEKRQVAVMVARFLGLDPDLQSDAADALAIAICHAHARKLKRLHAMAGS